MTGAACVGSISVRVRVGQTEHIARHVDHRHVQAVADARGRASGSRARSARRAILPSMPRAPKPARHHDARDACAARRASSSGAICSELTQSMLDGSTSCARPACVNDSDDAHVGVVQLDVLADQRRCATRRPRRLEPLDQRLATASGRASLRPCRSRCDQVVARGPPSSSISGTS